MRTRSVHRAGRLVTVGVLVALSLLAATTRGISPAQADADAPSGNTSWLDAAATGHEIDVNAEGARGGVHRIAVSPDTGARYQRAGWAVCPEDTSVAVPLLGPGVSCTNASFDAAVLVCPAGQQSVNPLFVSVRDPGSTTGWGPWTVSEPARCVGPTDLVGELARELARLPLVASPVSVPPNGWVMVNMDTVVFTSRDAQVLDVVVLGTPVRVSARPVAFSWDFADGSVPLVTSDPGRPYPHQTVAHTYTRGGSYAVTLITTWEADFQVIGSGTWTPVPGTATTTSPGAPLQVYEARSHLVDGPCPRIGPCTPT